MSLRRELISRALQKRFEEVCAERIAQFSGKEFSERESFVSEVRRRFASASPEQIHHFSFSVVPETWTTSNTDCLSALSALALGERLPVRPMPHPGVASFLEALNYARPNAEQSFLLLTERYANPLNLVLPDENAVREHLLTRLMVHSRATVERSSIATTEIDDLLLKLNLVAINASRTTDLRFLDALNYYYELLPGDRQPHIHHNWLLVSYLALYAQALAAWLSRDK